MAKAVVRDGRAQSGFVSALTIENILAPLKMGGFHGRRLSSSQRSECPPNLDLLRRSVKLLSVGTHDGNIHERLSEQFERDGWRIIAELAPWTEHESALGKFSTADGILTVENTVLP